MLTNLGKFGKSYASIEIQRPASAGEAAADPELPALEPAEAGHRHHEPREEAACVTAVTARRAPVGNR